MTTRNTRMKNGVKKMLKFRIPEKRSRSSEALETNYLCSLNAVPDGFLFFSCFMMARYTL